MLEQVVTAIACAMVLLMLPLLYRSVVGPTIIDRMIGLNVIGAKATVLLLLIGICYGRLDMFVDLALTYALLNFLGSVAASHLLERLPEESLRDKERQV